MNTPEFYKLEISSTNGLSNAHSLAEIGRSLINYELVSQKALSESFSDVDQSLCDCLGFEIPFTKGGFGNNWAKWMKEYGDFKGWSGFGGSLFIFDEKLNVSFAYTPSLLLPGIAGGTRAPLLAQRIFEKIQKK